MADVFTKAKRSEVMSRIRSRGNKDTELALARLLRANGISGWRRHVLVRATVERSKLRVESGRKQSRTSPRPSPQRFVFSRTTLTRSATTLSRSHGRGNERGAGVRRRNTQLPTLNAQLTVRPDFVFRKLRTVIFVDGCFWHGCPKHATMPKNNREFWRRKLSGNRTRDGLVTRALRRAGWRVLRVWEHQLARKNRSRLVRRIQLVMCD